MSIAVMITGLQFDDHYPSVGWDIAGPLHDKLYLPFENTVGGKTSPISL